MSLVNALLPPATVPGIPANETWHPLLGDQPRGSVYFTINTSGPAVVFGSAADFGKPGLIRNYGGCSGELAAGVG